MQRVTGIGGIFFRAKDASALQAWYKRHLGIDVQEWGGRRSPGPTVKASRLPVRPSGPSARLRRTCLRRASFMVNYRAQDLHALVKVLRAEGCNVLDRVDDSEYGKFAWAIDPEGNKVELWQPPAGQ
ncbi:MAG TPA: VOC family protein [Steroidobacteraceae bacterium]|jgi:predicted enzyme related to lactoylglutathione lyase